MSSFVQHIYDDSFLQRAFRTRAVIVGSDVVGVTAEALVGVGGTDAAVEMGEAEAVVEVVGTEAVVGV